jgi:hypothetical protein
MPRCYPRASGLRQSLSAPAGSRTFPTLSLRIFPYVPGPHPGGSCGAHTRFFPQDNGLPDVRTRSAPYHIHTATSVWARFRGCSHSLMFRPAGLLATPIAPTAALYTLGSRGFYVRAYHGSSPPRAPDMLTVRFGQLTVRGLPPLKIRSLVGCSPNARAQGRRDSGVPWSALCTPDMGMNLWGESPL